MPAASPPATIDAVHIRASPLLNALGANISSKLQRAKAKKAIEKPRSKWDLPCAENRCQCEEAAVGDGGTAGVAAVDRPIQKRAHVWVALQQQDRRVPSQLRDLQKQLENARFSFLLA